MQPTYRPGVTLCELHTVLPERITSVLEQALPELDRKLHGFAAPDAVLTAPETRSSSPVRILRDETRQSQLRGLYPCGEGAGYAGGHHLRRAGRHSDGRGRDRSTERMKMR